MREAISAEQASTMNEAANIIVAALMEPNEPPIAMTILGMVCAKIIYACTQDRQDFDETCQILAKQIQDMVNAEEADGVVRWEKAN